jgi:hypothetical protein
LKRKLLPQGKKKDDAKLTGLGVTTGEISVTFNNEIECEGISNEQLDMHEGMSR